MIVVTGSGPQQPALLLTCTQIRDEAISVYYTLNTFALIVIDHDALPICPFYDLFNKHSRAKETTGKKNVLLDLQGKKDWSNLLHWVKMLIGRPSGSSARPEKLR